MIAFHLFIQCFSEEYNIRLPLKNSVNCVGNKTKI